ncbi:MAG: PRC-barrel domain-containing protein [Brevundimonas sp.]
MTDTMNYDTDSRLIAADKVEGTEVFNPAGDKLGVVRDIYIDKRSAQAEFASIGFGGFLGMGEDYHPVPWRLLDYDTRKEGFVVDLDRDVLREAPSFASDRLDRDTGWREDVRSYYSGRPDYTVV